MTFRMLVHIFVSFVLITALNFASSPASAQAPAQIQVPSAAPSIPAEISVTAEQRYFSPLSIFRLSASLEAAGPNAEAAVQSLETATAKLKEAVKSLSTRAVVYVRKESLHNANRENSAPSGNSAIKAQRQISVETTETDKAGKLIDLLFRSGVSAITQTQLFSPSEDRAHLDAVQQATDKAKRKAELVAASLGVKLGNILSASVTEEPPATELREGIEHGLGPISGGVQDSNVLVTVRFEVVH